MFRAVVFRHLSRNIVSEKNEKDPHTKKTVFFFCKKIQLSKEKKTYTPEKKNAPLPVERRRFCSGITKLARQHATVWNDCGSDIKRRRMPSIPKRLVGTHARFSDGKITENPATWETTNWPQPDSPFLSTDYAIDEQAFRNRLHP